MGVVVFLFKAHLYSPVNTFYVAFNLNILPNIVMFSSNQLDKLTGNTGIHFANVLTELGSVNLDKSPSGQSATQVRTECC